MNTELLYHDLTEFEMARRLTLEHGEWSGELHQSTRDNHEIIVHSHWILARDQQEQPNSIMLVNSDATEKPANRLESPGKLTGGFRGLIS